MPASDDCAIARVFYALRPPPSLRLALGELARDAARRAHGRPVPADNIHLTLAFVGDISVDRMPGLLELGAALRAQRISVQLDAQGEFRRAGVAWIAPSAPPRALMALAADLRSGLDAAGVPQEERPFHPHLTLARRCRGPYMPERVESFAWLVDHVALMQSVRGADGGRYRVLQRWSLEAMEHPR